VPVRLNILPKWRLANRNNITLIFGGWESLPGRCQAKIFYFIARGGESSLAFTKEHKAELLDQYEKWLNQSQVVLMLEYNHMGMKDIDVLRAKAREAGGQVHVVKNTLLGMALDKAGIKDKKYLEGTSLVGFALSDAAALAKVFNDAAKGSEIFKLKGGYMDGQAISSAEITALAELPPLPVMRARLLGLLVAPASKLVRTLAEPARQVAAVVKAYSEKEPAKAAA
jgi:large subunit ribosomal protein L10